MLLNVRDLSTKEWTREIYPFTEEMRGQLQDVYGTENVRTISQEDYERHLIRQKQDVEYEQAAAAEEQKEQREQQEQQEDPAPPTLEQLRALRVKYFTSQQTKKKKPTSNWSKRLRPRKR